MNLFHGRGYDYFGGIPGYVVISIIALLPLVYLWWRGDQSAQKTAVQTSPQVA